MIPQISAASAYDVARAAIAPAGARGAAPAAAADGPMASGDRFLAALDRVDATAQGAVAGTTGTQQLVQTIAEAEVVLETVVAIRDKVVEAYQEILRMPV